MEVAVATRFKKPKAPPPPQVLAAQFRGDTDALRRMGRVGGKKGGKTTARQKQHEAILEEVERQRILEECWERDVQANLHTHPIDD